MSAWLLRKVFPADLRSLVLAHQLAEAVAQGRKVVTLYLPHLVMVAMVV
jgi:hypothetical protein